MMRVVKLAQVAQKGGGSPPCGNIHGQVGGGLKQS